MALGGFTVVRCRTSVYSLRSSSAMKALTASRSLALVVRAISALFTSATVTCPFRKAALRTVALRASSPVREGAFAMVATLMPITPFLGRMRYYPKDPVQRWSISRPSILQLQIIIRLSMLHIGTYALTYSRTR